MLQIGTVCRREKEKKSKRFAFLIGVSHVFYVIQTQRKISRIKILKI